MNPVFFQQLQPLEPATDLVGKKTGRGSQSSGKENDSEISVDSAQPHPNKRQRLFNEAMACATIHLTAETSTSSVVCAHLFPTGSPLPQSCIQGALPPRFFKHIRPEQAFSPLTVQLDGELSELSDDEGNGDPMDGAACRAFNSQNPGTPLGRDQGGFVTPIDSDDELCQLLGRESSEDRSKRSPSGLAKFLESKFAAMRLPNE